MTGIHPAVVELSGGNLTLVAVVALIALGALAMAWMFRQEVLAAGEGTDNMKNIAHAVQEGANAYLTRQFRTLGVFAARGVLPAARAARRRRGGADLPVGLLPDRRRLLGRDRLPRHVPGRPRQPARGRRRPRRGPRPGDDDRLPHRRLRRHARPSASACSAPASSCSPSRTRPRTCSRASASAPRCSPCSCESAAASSPRPPTSAPTWSARSSRTSPRTTRATPPRSPTTSATTSATAPAWPPTSSSRTP